jgi:hypothetical protein
MGENVHRVGDFLMGIKESGRHGGIQEIAGIRHADPVRLENKSFPRFVLFPTRPSKSHQKRPRPSQLPPDNGISEAIRALPGTRCESNIILAEKEEVALVARLRENTLPQMPVSEANGNLGKCEEIVLAGTFLLAAPEARRRELNLPPENRIPHFSRSREHSIMPRPVLDAERG